MMAAQLDRRDKALALAIGDAAMVRLAESFGGTRLYLPRRVKAGHAIASAIGEDKARALCGRFGPGTIRVPLARELRALHYRAEGNSNARIAVRLGLTEGGVRSLFKRLERARQEAGEEPRPGDRPEEN